MELVHDEELKNKLYSLDRKEQNEAKNTLCNIIRKFLERRRRFCKGISLKIKRRSVDYCNLFVEDICYDLSTLELEKYNNGEFTVPIIEDKIEFELFLLFYHLNFGRYDFTDGRLYDFYLC